jgi:lipopolysaccharide transport system ATP-binding protein
MTILKINDSAASSSLIEDNNHRSLLDNNLAISVKNVSKMYPLYADPQARLRQSLWYALPKFLRGNHPPEFYKEFWALRNISFEVKKGETVGIIGRNGSGKSTLLQIIAGTLVPTGGEVGVNGRVAALLELGSGFNPEFTGRENVYLSGSILGFSREEIDDLFDEIAAFADIGQFIDQPVKLYSSGMFVRLAFAVHACVKPEILIVDEALAVGDVFFRQKCYARFQKLMGEGTSILFVTHSLPIIEEMCQYAILLNQGQSIFQGEPIEAVKQFLNLERQTKPKIESADDMPPDDQKIPLAEPPTNYEIAYWPLAEQFLPLSTQLMEGLKQAYCLGVAICDDAGRSCLSFQQGEWVTVYSEFKALVDVGIPLVNIIIRNDRNLLLHGRSSLHYLWPQIPAQLSKNERIRFKHTIKLDVLPGEYTLGLELVAISLEDYLEAGKMSHEEIIAKSRALLTIGRQISFMVTQRHNGLTLLGHGLCNLPGNCVLSVIS